MNRKRLFSFDLPVRRNPQFSEMQELERRLLPERNAMLPVGPARPCVGVCSTLNDDPDPDEWVIQDRVAPRPEDQFRFSDAVKWTTVGVARSHGSLCGLKHGEADHEGDTIQVRCRRRDLPKPEQPVSDGRTSMNLSSTLRLMAQHNIKVELAIYDGRLLIQAYARGPRVAQSLAIDTIAQDGNRPFTENFQNVVKAAIKFQ